MEIFKKLFGKKDSVKRRHLRDVKPGEYINIEWLRISGGLGHLKCINNDPTSKKILLQARWGNYKEFNIQEYQQIVFEYDSDVFKNFALLNPEPLVGAQDTETETEQKALENYLKVLENNLGECLKKEDYESARNTQDKIDTLLKFKR